LKKVEKKQNSALNSIRVAENVVDLERSLEILDYAEFVLEIWHSGAKSLVLQKLPGSLDKKGS
jgi:hypothetical protein